MFASGNTLEGGNALPASIVVIVILGLLIFACMTAIRVWRRGSTSTETASVDGDPAITELKARFARGEIGDDEYLRKTRLLGLATPLAADEHSTPHSI
jgi:uncharacterized membrane protein